VQRQCRAGTPARCSSRLNKSPQKVMGARRLPSHNWLIEKTSDRSAANQREKEKLVIPTNNRSLHQKELSSQPKPEQRDGAAAGSVFSWNNPTPRKPARPPETSPRSPHTPRQNPLPDAAPQSSASLRPPSIPSLPAGRAPSSAPGALPPRSG